MTMKTQKLNFQIFHCSIVYNYCSIVCLIIKVGQNIVENYNISYENEIHMVDSSWKEDSKNIIFFVEEALILGRDSQKKGKMAKNRETYWYAN